MIHVSLLTVFAGQMHQCQPIGLCYSMLVVFVTLACIVCVCMYTGWGLMSVLGRARRMLLTDLFGAGPDAGRSTLYVWCVLIVFVTLFICVVCMCSCWIYVCVVCLCSCLIYVCGRCVWYMVFCGTH